MREGGSGRAVDEGAREWKAVQSRPWRCSAGPSVALNGNSLHMAIRSTQWQSEALHMAVTPRASAAFCAWLVARSRVRCIASEAIVSSSARATSPAKGMEGHERAWKGMVGHHQLERARHVACVHVRSTRRAQLRRS